MQILQALQHGGAGMSGPPAGYPAPPPQGGGGERSGAQLLSQMIQLALQFQDDPEEKGDPQDMADIAKVLTMLRAIKLREQQEKDAAIGAGPAVKFLRRARQG